MGKKRPNVIICLCDQLRAFEVGCHGNKIIRTPNIDRLAANGVRFETACSNNPVCTPARSILLSGQYSRTCAGMLGNVSDPVPERRRLKDPTIAEAFRSAGYRTGLIGKWHIDPEPGSVGFDDAVYPFFRHRYTGQTYLGPNGSNRLIQGFTTEFEGEQLERYIPEHRDNPFFLYYNISQPHMPVADAPEEYMRMYPRDGVPLRENVRVNGQPAYDEHWFKVYLWDYLYYREHLPYTEGELADGFDLRDLTALYYGMTTWADDQVGTLMQILDQNGLTEDTIVLFTSDHGDNLGSHHLFNKEALYEESIRIPMIVHWPAELGPRVVGTQVASLVDVMPTILSLAGVETPITAQGTDLSEVVRGRAETVGENAAYIETSRRQVGIRTLTHLYGVTTSPERAVTDDRHMFFNVQSDPLQERNLAATGDEAETAGLLRERVLRWNRETPWLRT